MSPETGFQRFIRGLLTGDVVERDGEIYVLPSGRSGPAAEVEILLRSGALAGDPTTCRANAQTRGWLKRSRLDADMFAMQHRTIQRTAGGQDINLLESPLARLALAAGRDSAFLGPHHLEAGERVRRLVERAQLQPRLTMTYSGTRIAGSRQQITADISDLAADARRDVAAIHRLLPGDCAGVVMDVGGLLKGLQEVERERRWPRRSAKLVLRIGLEQLAQHYGLGPFAMGKSGGQRQSWMEPGSRPQRFE